MVRKVDNELLIYGREIEFQTHFTIINKKKSFAFISVPFKAVKSLGWTKETKLIVSIKEVEK